VLNDEVKQAIQGAYSSWLAARSLKPRTGQRAMIAHIANALARRGHEDAPGSPICVVEAGTGTGKTIAYVVAALPIAQALGRKLVISTATVALQEQLVYRDLPDLQRAGAIDFSFALAKGRGRYVCPARLDLLVRSNARDETQIALVEEPLNLSPDALQFYRALTTGWSEGSWAGDRDSWPESIPDGRWALATTDHHQCSGRRCSYVSQCPFFTARAGLESADCVVANHDLVLADIALGGGAVLPEPEESIYIFDEAHHLPDKACSHWSFHARIGLAREHLAEGSRLATTLLAEPRNGDAVRRHLAPVPGLCIEADGLLCGLAAELHALLPQAPRQGDSAVEFRLPHGRVPSDIAGRAAALHNSLASLASAVQDAADDLSRSLEQGGATAQQRFAALGLLGARAERLAGLWQAWAEPDPEGEAPRARWIRIAERRSVEDLEVSVAPVLASTLLFERVWSRVAGAVLTSATLTALGSFERILLRAGLPDDCLFATVPSPFDYRARACLAVPKLAADPGDPAAHTREVARWLEVELDQSQASLVLFASRKQMREVYDRVSLSLRDCVLLQDHFGKQELLRLHRQRVDAGEGSVIFGLASFAEGIDLPGSYCMHVVIAKLPFAVPDDPVEAALAEWIESRGGNPFMEISVPDAALRLVQASGRLLRTEEDTGRITLLDRRVITKAYGRKILDSLPPFRREIG
jgi:ATP-dependent DNA helicase DinG